jgi:hypothetical protein
MVGERWSYAGHICAGVVFALRDIFIPCGPHANLFDRLLREEEHRKNFWTLIVAEKIMMDTNLKPQGVSVLNIIRSAFIRVKDFSFCFSVS